MKNTKKIVLAAGWLLCAAALLFLTAYLHGSIRLSRDDFFYYPFFRHGMQDAAESFVSHYIHTNGRLLVHAVCALLLCGNQWTFAMVNIAVLMVFLLLLSRFAEPEPGRRPMAFLLCFSGFWLIGNSITSEAVIWISGSFNYLFPAMLLAAYLAALTSAKNKMGRVLACVLGLLSAATTEISSVLTLVLTFFYFFSNRKNQKGHRIYVFTDVVLVFIGLLFLILSPGMHSRADADRSLTEIIERFFINLTTFAQMSWEPGGIGGILIFTALSCALCAYKTLRQKALSVVLLLVAAAAVLTITGIIYSAWCYIAFSFLFLGALALYGVLLYRRDEKMVLICVFCFAIAFAVMCASGIVGYRMLFVPALCLLAAGLRSVSLARPSLCLTVSACVVMTLFACLQIYSMAVINQKNAAVWDENQEKILQYQGQDMITFRNVFDEAYFQGGIPVDNNFGDGYLNEFGISGEVTARSAEPYYKVTDSGGAAVTEKAIKRYDDYYLSLEELAGYMDLEHVWQNQTSEIYYKGELYRFHYGARSVLTAYVGGWSKKLEAPVRIVDSDLKISLRDINRLFGLNLMVSDKTG